MMTTGRSVVRAVFTVDVEHLTHEQRDRLAGLIDEAVHRVMHPEEEPVVLGWTPTAFREALARLDAANATVQAAVIRTALKQGGYVSREEVYRIGQYPTERTLRGFTRPANRIVADMKQAGEVLADAVDILSPSYRTGVQADGFTVHPDLAVLLG